MTRWFSTWGKCWLGAVVCLLAGAVFSFADEDDGPGKGKGKGPKGAKEVSGIIQIDLSKLPPDLAREVMRYAKGKAPYEKMAPKGKGKEAKGQPMQARAKG